MSINFEPYATDPPVSPTPNSGLGERHSLISPRREEVANALSVLRHSPVTIDPFSSTVAPMLSAAQFQQLLVNLTDTIKSAAPTPSTKEDNPFAIARAEFYISQGLTFKFDGTHENLAPWIKKFKALRGNALWREATYLQYEGQTYDILTEFTKIKESYIKPQARQRCTQENQAKSLKPEHTTLFYARILGKVVISSVTDEFYTILQNYAGDNLAGDGPFLLWLILTHFHTSTITYQEQLKTQVRSRSLAADHQDDVENYLLWLRHHLDVLATISSSGISGHSDLIDPIFQQLLTTKSTRLRRLVEDWHLSYHSEEKEFTPKSLVEDADKKCKALRQSNQLYTNTDADIMALLSAHRQPTSATLPTPGKQSHIKQVPSDIKGQGQHRSPRPQWFNMPPNDPNQTRQYENRVWHWCPKCGERGKWVCTHSAATHTDNFVKKRKGDPAQGTRRPSPSPPPTAHVATSVDYNEIAKIVATQFATQLQAHLAAPFPLASAPTPSAPDDTGESPMGAEEW
jgi:hypothetical protein